MLPPAVIPASTHTSSGRTASVNAADISSAPRSESTQQTTRKSVGRHLARQPREPRPVDDLVGEQHVANPESAQHAHLADGRCGDGDGARAELAGQQLRRHVFLTYRGGELDSTSATPPRHRHEIVRQRGRPPDAHRPDHAVGGQFRRTPADLRGRGTPPPGGQSLEPPVERLISRRRDGVVIDEAAHRFIKVDEVAATVAACRAVAKTALSWHPVTPTAGGDNAPENDPDIPEQFRIRQAKRERLLADGRDPYPAAVDRTHTLAEVRAAFPHLPVDSQTGEVVGVAGRVVFARDSGKLCFATIQEGDGAQLQAMVSLAEVGQESLDSWKADVDLGDIVFLHGQVISSRRGELSVLVDSWQIVSKSLRPLPVAHREMSEEARVRQRYVDLIVRPEARTIARQRVAVVRAVRNALERRGFLELETPMLQTLAGGAAARPFVTHSNALDVDLYLRIAPELFLKRALVGGFEKVFELNRNFRNEGIDSTHSPEFAMLETYQAYGDYNDSAVVTRELIQEVADEAIGTRQVPLADGTVFDLDGEWDSVEMYPSLSAALGEEITPQTTAEELWRIVDRLGVEIPRDRGYGHGKLVEELWEHTVGEDLWAPTFVRDFPVETTPLTRSHRSIPGVTEKWDLYVRKFELATGYSELTDPVIQRQRFEAQARAAAAGDDEAMVLDDDFLTALEYGMPPTTGTGMGIDRLLMALTGLSIRETILFPIVRRHTK